VGLAQAVSKLVSQASSSDGLHSKAGVPQLGAIVALHLHAVLGHPQEVIHSGDVPARYATVNQWWGLSQKFPFSLNSCLGFLYLLEVKDKRKEDWSSLVPKVPFYQTMPKIMVLSCVMRPPTWEVYHVPKESASDTATGAASLRILTHVRHDNTCHV